MRKMKDELTREKGLEHAEDKFIEALIYHRMWSYDAFWKTIGAVTEGLKILSIRKTSLGS